MCVCVCMCACVCVFYSKSELPCSSSVNLFLAKFFKNTCLKFGNHDYVVFPNDITSIYYSFNDIFFPHFYKEEFCIFFWTILGVTLKYTTFFSLLFEFFLFLSISYFYKYFYNYDLKAMKLVLFIWSFRDIWKFLRQNKWQNVICFVNLSLTCCFIYRFLYVCMTVCYNQALKRWIRGSHINVHTMLNKVFKVFFAKIISMWRQHQKCC